MRMRRPKLFFITYISHLPHHHDRCHDRKAHSSRERDCGRDDMEAEVAWSGVAELVVQMQEKKKECGPETGMKV